MSNESLGDLIKKLAGEGGNHSSSNNNGPIFKTKSVNESKIPEFKVKTEYFERQSKKSNESE
jgi:hypothetical protein